MLVTSPVVDLVTAPLPRVVEVGSLAYFQACVAEVPWTMRIGYLAEVEMIRRRPLWLEALRLSGLFQQRDIDRPPKDEGEVDLAPDESIDTPVGASKAIAALTQFMTTVHKSTYPIMRDPRSGAALTPVQQQAKTLVWGEQMQATFKGIVADFLTNIKPGSAQDCDNANAALLLACACAGGDARSACDLFAHFPESVCTPIEVNLLRSAFHSDRTGLAAPLLAAQYNHIHVLQALQHAGWDPLTPLQWIDNSQWQWDSTQHDQAPCFVRGAFKLLDDNVFTTELWHPSTVGFFLDAIKSANAQTLSPGVRSAFNGFLCQTVQGTVADRDWRPLYPVLKSSGSFVDNCNTILARVVQCGNLDVLEHLRETIDWRLHSGAKFVAMHLFDGNCAFFNSSFLTKDELSLKLIQWCIADGCVDTLMAPHLDDRGQLTHIAHTLAENSASASVLALLEAGLNVDTCKHDGDKRVSLLQTAENAGHYQLASMVRSFAVKRTIETLFDSGELSSSCA